MLQARNAALVVEPSPLIAAAAADILAQLGFARVELAAGIDAALVLIEQQRFDFALVSVFLRGESIAEITTPLDLAGIRYLLVSDLADGRDRPEELSHARFITKPYGLSDIASALAQEQTRAPTG